MNKEQAHKMIRETFENPFDKNRFIIFVKNLLNRIDESKAFHGREYVKEEFKDSIRTYERVGTYSDPEDKKIDILIVYLQRGYSPDRARGTQRNFAGTYLKDRGEKDAGLFAFVSPDAADWRFSLVRMDYKFEKTQTGKIKVKEELTPARRWSFPAGKNENSHTAQSRLAGILENDENSPALKDLEDAFDIETVTKEFFLKYRDLFLRTKEELDRILKKSPKVRADFDSKGTDTVNFAKKLLGQIAFLYFLQKKGWFGARRDADWGTGSKYFLRELSDKKHGGYKNFFNDMLEPLFYEALRTDRSRENDFYSPFDCRIPFLNGGLFDPPGGYDWKHTDILLPDDLFSNTRKTKAGDTGDGILDVFDRYNFTVREDEPLEKEVAIDPELLGKAYEKFNAIRPDNFDEFTKALKSGRRGEENKFNKKFGVYYTPREIVHYMCRQSLIAYLYAELNSSPYSYEKIRDPQFDMFGNKGKEGQPDLIIEHKPDIKKADIEILIQSGEQVSGNEARVIREGRETRIYAHKLPESIRKNAGLIDQKLADITVCDPAVGSGAFPVGMMNEIVRARNVLSVFIKDPGRNDCEFKRRCIEHSLYGADIDPGAAEIAKLRLWLSLVVDEENVKKIKPLPNLDYKIVCGNSLLGVKEDLFNQKLFYKLEDLKRRFFNETDPENKAEYKKQIDGLISDMTKGHTRFDFKLYFSEVFGQKGGFDVVIGNPPYVRADNPGIKSLRKVIMKSGLYHTLYEKWDLYVAFIEKGYNILKEEGVLAFIIPDAYMSSKYAKKSHAYFLKNAVISRINFLNDIKIFEAAVKNIIIEFRKGNDPKNIPAKIKHSPAFENFIAVPSKPQTELGEFAFKIENESSTIGNLKNTLKWGEICYVSYGLRPNSDERYWRGEFAKKDLIAARKDALHPKPYIEGKWISRYLIEEIKYLEWNTERSPEKLVRPTFPELYEPEKIIRGRMTDAVYDDQGLLCNDSCFVSVLWKDLRDVLNKSIAASIKKDFNLKDIRGFRKELEANSEKFSLKYLLAILNSKLAAYYLNQVRRSRISFYPDDLKQLPIKIISEKDQHGFVILADKILADKKQNSNADTSQLEKQIDQFVYKLYELRPEEIKIVEGEND